MRMIPEGGMASFSYWYLQDTFICTITQQESGNISIINTVSMYNSCNTVEAIMYYLWINTFMVME